MSLEIERKFLIRNTDFKNEAFQKKTIQQGYLNSNKNRTVRIRIIDNKAYVTVKGISNKSGTTRFEWEQEINKTEAEKLLLLCEPTVIEKNRFYIKIKHHVFEVDEFFGDNNGLIVAEIELISEDESFEKPSWLGEEVTGVNKYYNANLSNHPYCNWK